MDSDQIIAIIGGLLVAFIVRVFNIVVEWLSRVLGVDPPEPIPMDATTPVETRTGADGTDTPPIPPAAV